MDRAALYAVVSGDDGKRRQRKKEHEVPGLHRILRDASYVSGESGGGRKIPSARSCASSRQHLWRDNTYNIRGVWAEESPTSTRGVSNCNFRVRLMWIAPEARSRLQ